MYRNRYEPTVYIVFSAIYELSHISEKIGKSMPCWPMSVDFDKNHDQLHE